MTKDRAKRAKSAHPVIPHPVILSLAPSLPSGVAPMPGLGIAPAPSSPAPCLLALADSGSIGLVFSVLLLAAVGSVVAYALVNSRRHRAAVASVHSDAARITREHGIPVSGSLSWIDVERDGGKYRVYTLGFSARPGGLDLPRLPGSSRLLGLISGLPGGKLLVADDVTVANGGVRLAFSGQVGLRSIAARREQMSRRIVPCARAAVAVGEALPGALCVALCTASGEQAIWALRTLLEFYRDHRLAGPAMEQALLSGGVSVRCEIARAERDLPAVRSLLLSVDGTEVPADLWLWALGKGGGDTESAALRSSALDHPDDEVVRAGMVGMETRGEVPAVQPLGQALGRAESDAVRFLLITALGKSGDPAAADVLRSVEGSKEVREMAPWALQACGAAEAAGGLALVESGEEGSLVLAAEGGELTLGQPSGDG